MKTINKLFALLFLIPALANAEAPSGYYKDAEGKNKAALLAALCDIVGPHTDVGYDGLWEVYKKSDVHPGTNKVWDMYSTATFIVGQKQCGNYKNVGDCYNREHSMPKSWFDERSPMKSDAFHIYPTDGKVNGQRSNYPYGECANGTSLSNGSIKGLGKLGKSTFPGYSGTVFEPDDEYKGDFARTYFYMAACYNDKIASWNSDMLAGNKYPAYTTWAVNLLMKWNEQDPVSQKEIDRNEAVYSYQHNRNPFIDHPELADYIWGDKQDEGWVPGGVVEPQIISPYDGDTYDLGITAIGKSIEQKITVKAQGLTKSLSVSVSGTGFWVSTNSISANSANSANGETITVRYTSQTATEVTGSLTIKSDEAQAVVTLKAQAVDGIPALNATNIGADRFTANWIDIDQDGSNYTLSVFLADGFTALPGYPKQVAAATQKYEVTGLDYSATYKYSLTNSSGQKSNVVTVTTAAPNREISFELPESGLVFSSQPNVASAPLSVTIYSEYVEEDEIEVSVTGAFEISEDKSNWNSTLEVSTKDTEDFGARIYVRMKAQPAGSYSGTLSASTPTVAGTDADITGTVAAPVTFFEDFEAPVTELSGYDGGPYEGNACLWELTNAGIYNERNGDKKNGKQSVRTDKSKEGTLEMLESKQDGAGVVTFLAAPYGTDEAATVVLYQSVSNGSWEKVKEFNVSEGSLKEYSATVNVAGPVRFKFEQTAGNRMNIDDVTITAYTMSSVNAIESSDWDAYCTAGQLHIETAVPSVIHIYSIDARQVYGENVAGSTSISLPTGYYIVVNGNDSRNVIVK